MSDQKNIVEEVLALKSKNLRFFEQYYPGIYNYFSAYQLHASKLDIQPQNAELDLIEDNKHIYGGAKQYALREASHFLEFFDYGKKVHSIKPLYKGDYKNQRFFAKHVDRIYQFSSLTEDSFAGYSLPDFFPLTVFMGSGLGLHIKALMDARDLRHIVVAETNMDRFFSSFYAVDWEEIVLPYLNDNERSFNFVLVPNAETEQQIRNVIWNQLIEYCPFFPVMTLFYNHLGSAQFDRIIDSINSDLYVHLFSFGNYDDEVNQLNNAIHNFKQGIKRLPLPGSTGFDLPVCIVGSGPSLDEKIEWLRALQGKAIIVSCGTALRALHKHGIKPDFQIELESDYNTFATQSLNEDKDFMRSIKLIGAAQLSPHLFTLFDEKRLFFKGEGVLNSLFSIPSESLKEAAPTCTNAALAFAFHYGFSEVFLFGLDYGFPDKDKHHASGAIYYKEDGPEGLKEATTHKDSDLISVESASGGTILTTNFLYASKRRVENIIQSVQHSKVYNCSNGCRLEGVMWLTETAFTSLQNNTYTMTKEDLTQALFNDHALGVSGDEIHKILQSLDEELSLMVAVFNQFLEKTINDSTELMTLCYRMNHWLQFVLKPKNESFYYFIRGSIWHFLHAGFSHGAAIEGRDLIKFVHNWQKEFQLFINKIQTHFTDMMGKDFDLDNDMLTKRSISAPESDYIAPAFMDLYWQALPLIIDENGMYSEYKL